MKSINFDRNWNCKLDSGYYTTIRSEKKIKEKDLHIGDEVVINEGNTIRYGKIEDISKPFELIQFVTNPLLRIILKSDTGFSDTEAMKILEDLYGTDKLVIIGIRQVQHIYTNL